MRLRFISRKAIASVPLAAGVYLTRLRHPDGAQTRRLLYLK